MPRAIPELPKFGKKYVFGRLMEDGGLKLGHNSNNGKGQTHEMVIDKEQAIEIHNFIAEVYL